MRALQVNATGHASTRRECTPRLWPWCVALAGVLGVTYLATLLRDVGYETDTAKFEYLGRVLGTAHMPGYPLYTAFLALFIRVIPVGGDAYRANLFSAVAGAATCVLLFVVLRHLGVRRSLALSAALLAGLTKSFWSQAIVAEVYTPYTLFTFSVIVLLLRWERTRATRDLVWALSVYALALAHSTASLLLAPALGIFVGVVDWRQIVSWRLLRWIPLFVLLSLGPYSYIVWRTADPSTLYREVQIRNAGDLVQALRGSNYAALMFAFRPRTVLTRRLPMLVKLLYQQPLLWTLPLVAAGIIRERLRPSGLLLLVLFVTTTTWALEYNIPDVFVYLILPELIIVLWAAVGAEWLIEAAPTPIQSIGVVCGMIAVALVGASNFRQVDLSHDRTGDQIRAALAAMPDGGVVFTYHYHHFNYELLEKGRQTALQVFVAYPLPTEQISRYCRGESISLGGVPKTPPAGLPVYAYTAPYLEMLRAQGWTLHPVTGELALIDCKQPATVTAS